MPANPASHHVHQNAIVPRHSWFNFRSERANWLSVLGLIVAVVSLIFAAIYAVDSFRLARWTSEKDYLVYCQSLLSASQALPSDCLQVVHATVGPPPFHSLDYFTLLVDEIKRFITGDQQQNDTHHELMDRSNEVPDSLPIVSAIAMMILCYGFNKIMFQEPQFRSRGHRRSFRIAIISAACLAALLFGPLVNPIFMEQQIFGGLRVGHALLLFTMIVTEQDRFSCFGMCVEFTGIACMCVILAKFAIWTKNAPFYAVPSIVVAISLAEALWTTGVLFPKLAPDTRHQICEYVDRVCLDYGILHHFVEPGPIRDFSGLLTEHQDMTPESIVGHTRQLTVT